MRSETSGKLLSQEGYDLTAVSQTFRFVSYSSSLLYRINPTCLLAHSTFIYLVFIACKTRENTVDNVFHFVGQACRVYL